MDDSIREKLVRCFVLVFPKLSEQQIPTASAGQMADWDSLAQVNLLSVIGEEFGIEIDFEEFEGATSFEKLLDRLRQLTASA